MDTYFPVEEFFQDDPALIEANKKTSSSYKIDFCIHMGFVYSKRKILHMDACIRTRSWTNGDDVA